MPPCAAFILNSQRTPFRNKHLVVYYRQDFKKSLRKVYMEWPREEHSYSSTTNIGYESIFITL